MNLKVLKFCVDGAKPAIYYKYKEYGLNLREIKGNFFLASKGTYKNNEVRQAVNKESLIIERPHTTLLKEIKDE